MALDNIVEKIESAGVEIPAEDRFEIEQWQRGRNLSAVPPHAWKEIEDMLGGYVARDTDNLLAIEPKDFEAVRAQHAIAHAAARIFKRFMEERDAALAAKAPPIVRAAAQKFSQVPPESM